MSDITFALNFGELLIAIVLLLLGTSLNFIYKYFDLRRNRKNIKNMIIQELKHNYKVLIKTYPEQLDSPDDMAIVHVMAATCSKFQSKYYELFLDCIAELNKDDIQLIYNVYKSMRYASNIGTDMVSATFPIEKKDEIIELISKGVEIEKKVA